MDRRHFVRAAAASAIAPGGLTSCANGLLIELRALAPSYFVGILSGLTIEELLRPGELIKRFAGFIPSNLIHGERRLPEQFVANVQQKLGSNEIAALERDGFRLWFADDNSTLELNHFSVKMVNESRKVKVVQVYLEIRDKTTNHIQLRFPLPGFEMAPEASYIYSGYFPVMPFIGAKELAVLVNDKIVAPSALAYVVPARLQAI
jgi:hypothetical protein